LRSKIQLLIPIAVLTSILATCLITSNVYAITNGQPDGNAHPYVGLIVFDDAPGHPAWRCTGTLLSPTIVLCAGHCTEGAVAGRIWFDEVVQGNPDYPAGGPSSHEIETIITSPQFVLGGGGGVPGFDTHDVGILILKEPVYMSEYGELPSQSLVDTLSMKTDVDLVGYGVQELWRGGGQPVWHGLRNRFYAPAQLDTAKFVWSDEFVRVTANPAQGKGGTAFGDSGGPVFLQGTRTIIAVNSYVNSNNCVGVTYSCRIDTADILPWIMSYLK
jgi:hypothetical protein